jgi:hypothetical protein
MVDDLPDYSRLSRCLGRADDTRPHRKLLSHFVECLLTRVQMIVFGNLSGLLNLILFVFLLTFLASIFASQLFRGEIPEQDEGGEPIQTPFFDIFNSFLGMYQIFSSENWTDILYTVTEHQKEFGTAWIGASFCILWFIFANCKWYSRDSSELAG